MGEEVENKETSLPQQSIKDYFNDLFSYMLSMGMSYDEFWNYDVLLVNNYIEARKIKAKENNFNAWLNGIYIQCAIGSCLSKECKYPKKPFAITQEEQEERDQESLRLLLEDLKANSK